MVVWRQPAGSPACWAAGGCCSGWTGLPAPSGGHQLDAPFPGRSRCCRLTWRTSKCWTRRTVWACWGVEVAPPTGTNLYPGTIERNVELRSVFWFFLCGWMPNTTFNSTVTCLSLAGTGGGTSDPERLFWSVVVFPPMSRYQENPSSYSACVCGTFVRLKLSKVGLT